VNEEKMKKVLLTQCQDTPGLIAKITGLCFEHNLNIIRNDEFVDRQANRFFMRTALEGDFNEPLLLSQLQAVLPSDANVSLKSDDKLNIVLLATKEAHCVGGVLLKCFENALNINVMAVIANHNDLAPLVNGFNVPFHHLPHDGLSREQYDNELANLIDSYQPELIGLAKYMRILSPGFVSRYAGKVINIQHSFLPAFIGAKPYHQAFERGVKIIGATAHFVTEALDEGPIIEQDITHVSHAQSAEKLALLGRDVEKTVFCRALLWAAEHKLFINSNKTVVFK
jgi:formyltetrahydrofolate deformylase